ncbi:putative endonuclease [Bacteroidales bacterium WCE2004]|nr:putative endonuclease [Bacteroidales bacterium WCE2004]
MRTDRATVGRKGEEEASSYLARLGHRILARNWRNGHLELDIITLLGNELHIVEVKSRVAPVMAEPEQNVRRDKQRRMVAAANAFLRSADRKGLPADLEIIFDVMSVVFFGTGADFEIEYYPNAFIPLYA